MKKTIIIVVVILLVAFIYSFFIIKNMQAEKQEVASFNSEYEYYNSNNLNGLDVVTLINKATSNNEKNNVEKDKEGLFDLSNENSIEIYITMIINEKTYRMEKISELGITSFVEYFGPVGFKCTNVEYHKSTGRIASMTFEATSY